MAKKPAKSKAKDRAKGKAKGKDTKGKQGKNAKETAVKPVAAPPEEPKEEKIQEPIVMTQERAIEEPCLFNCSQGVVTYRPNSYPGILAQPKTMAVAGSECGSYDSLCKLLHSAFRCADRVYTMVPWGNYVLFRAHNGTIMTYYIFDGCSCNINHFRYLDLSCGTAGLLYFEEMHKLIHYLIMSRSRREEIKNLKRCLVDDVCKELYGADHI